jgi:hypothetical protein
MNKLKTIIFLGFLIRVLYAVNVGLKGPELGLELDAQGFYLRMVVIARSGVFEPLRIGETAMLNSIGTLMTVFGQSVFFACLCSAIAWWCAGLIFVAALRLIEGTDKSRMILCLLFAFWPTAIPYTATPLREAWQLLFANMFIYSLISRIYINNFRIWFIMIVGALGSGFLHGSLTIFVVGSISIYFILNPMIGKNKIPVGRLIVTFFSVFIFLYFGYSNISNFNYDVSGGVINSIQTYQDNVLSAYARTAYKANSYTTSGISATLSLPWGFLQYLFEPFPQKIGSIADVVLGIENSIRFFMITGVLYAFRKYNDRDARIKIAIVFGCYLIQEGVWSVGTVNWGTASRHHVPALGLLLLAAAQSGFLWRRFAGPERRPLQSFQQAR